MNLTETIKHLLDKKNMTQAQLADKLGISSTNLSNKMNRSTFSPEELIKIAHALDMQLAFVGNNNTVYPFESDPIDENRTQRLQEQSLRNTLRRYGFALKKGINSSGNIGYHVIPLSEHPETLNPNLLWSNGKGAFGLSQGDIDDLFHRGIRLGKSREHFFKYLNEYFENLLNSTT